MGQPGFHYLISDSYALLGKFLKTHPVPGTLGLLVLFGVVLGILKRTFGRIAGDVIVFALIICAIVLIFGGSLFTFFHMKGFHFGG